MRLVLVHGRDQQAKDQVELKRSWLESLDVGLSEAGLPSLPTKDIAFPYYGDELDRLIKIIRTPLTLDIIAKGATADVQTTDFRGRLFEELAKSAGLTHEQITNEYSGVVTQKGPLNWEWVQSILRSLDSTPIGSTTIDIFTRDVYIYLTNPSVQAAVNQIVAQTLTEEPCVVVAHSLGTLVTYRLLRDPACRANVKRLITVGSPLGLNTIREFIIPPSLANPSGVTEWFNAYDSGDVVALKPLDVSTWDIIPAITNKGDIKNWTKNRHGIAGYLDDPIVAKWIYDAVKSE